MKKYYKFLICFILNTAFYANIVHNIVEVKNKKLSNMVTF